MIKIFKTAVTCAMAAPRIFSGWCVIARTQMRAKISFAGYDEGKF
jgi:hypothetical protein